VLVSDANDDGSVATTTGDVHAERIIVWSDVLVSPPLLRTGNIVGVERADGLRSGVGDSAESPTHPALVEVVLGGPENPIFVGSYLRHRFLDTGELASIPELVVFRELFKADEARDGVTRGEACFDNFLSYIWLVCLVDDDEHRLGVPSLE
jgi:hypothetical protein